jgi:hypothetical protein
MKMDVAREVLDRHYLTPLEPGSVAIVGASDLGQSSGLGAFRLSRPAPRYCPKEHKHHLT